MAAYTPIRLCPVSESRVSDVPTDESSIIGYESTWLADFTELQHPYLDTGRIALSASNNSAKFTDTAARTATVPAGNYANTSAVIGELIAQMNAAGGGTDYSGTWGIGSSNRFKAKISKGAGTFSLDIASDANSIFSKVLGFGNEDLAAATSHTAIMRSVTSRDGVRIQWDTLTDTNFNYVCVANPILSPAGRARVVFGSSTTSRDVVIDLLEVDKVMVAYFSLISYRYVTLELIDPYRDDLSFVGCGGFSAGVYYEPSQNWDWNSYSHTDQPGITTQMTIKGHPQSTEVSPKRGLALSFGSSLTPDDSDAFYSMCMTLGKNDKVIVTTDPENNLTRESGIYTLKEPPSFDSEFMGHNSGRWTLSLSLVEDVF